MWNEAAANPQVAPTGASVSGRSQTAVAVRNLGKCYRIYKRPQDRLKQALFRGRRRYFREFWALRNVSLEIRRGETVGIMGRNGCGKSTLLQLVCDTLKPTTGQVEVNGRVSALLELGTGFNPEFSGRDNVYTNAAILGLSRAEIDARYDDIVAFADLGEFIDRPVKTYSSGMHVRLAFAVAASIEPEILVVDEALAVGDEAFRRKCYARIEDIKKGGGTILFVSHSAGTVIELCDRAALLDRGELLLTGRPKMVVEKYHKLLFSRPGEAGAIREEIKRVSQSPPSFVENAPQPATQQGQPTAGAYFDPGMNPNNTVVYKSCGAQIIDPHISTPDGRRVNVLVPNRPYMIKYRVRFARPAREVAWGTLIKTIRGVRIAGVAKPRKRREQVPAGSLVHVAFTFRCVLMPGVYFANAGVFGVVDGREGYLHRMTDVLMFRVLQEDCETNTGIVDCFVRSRISFEGARGREVA